MLKGSVIILLIAFIRVASANDANIREAMSFEFSRLVYLIKHNAWQELKEYESKNIKCGFGPGEEGYGCIEKMMKNDLECKREVLFALEQGCHFEQREGGASCLAPPQYSDPKVLMPLNSRVSLRYAKETSKVTIDFMICGGD